MCIQTPEELEFAVFCIENAALSLQKQPDEIYQVLKESGLLQNYLIANYEMLHTQSKEYIVNDLTALMQEKGLL